MSEFAIIMRSRSFHRRARSSVLLVNQSSAELTEEDYCNFSHLLIKIADPVRNALRREEIVCMMFQQRDDNLVDGHGDTFETECRIIKYFYRRFEREGLHGGGVRENFIKSLVARKLMFLANLHLSSSQRGRQLFCLNCRQLILTTSRKSSGGNDDEIMLRWNSQHERLQHEHNRHLIHSYSPPRYYLRQWFRDRIAVFNAESHLQWHWTRLRNVLFVLSWRSSSLHHVRGGEKNFCWLSHVWQSSEKMNRRSFFFLLFSGTQTATKTG